MDINSSVYYILAPKYECNVKVAEFFEQLKERIEIINSIEKTELHKQEEKMINQIIAYLEAESISEY